MTCLAAALNSCPAIPSTNTMGRNTATVVSVDAVTAGQIRHGRDFRVSPFQVRANARYVKAITPEGELVAIGEARLPHLYHPILVL